MTGLELRLSALEETVRMQAEKLHWQETVSMSIGSAALQQEAARWPQQNAAHAPSTAPERAASAKFKKHFDLIESLSEDLTMLAHAHAATADRLKAVEAALAAYSGADITDNSGKVHFVNVSESTDNGLGAQNGNHNWNVLDDILKDLAEIRAWKAAAELQGRSEQQVKRDETFITLTMSETLEVQQGSLQESQYAHIHKHVFEHREYVWEGSVYDALFLCMLPFLTLSRSLLIAFGFVCNILMVVITVRVVSSEGFLENPFSGVEDYTNWRTWDAHSLRYADPLTSMSLATRVCSRDQGLSVALEQKTLMHEVIKYSESSQGFLLCNVAVILWVCCCSLEIRQTLNFFLAVFCLPRTTSTAIVANDDGLEFAGISKRRFLFGAVISLVRGCFAIILMIQGSIWLAYTSSIENLLLNASALGFVLDIDNTVFGVVAPMQVVGYLNSLKPGKLPRSHLLIMVPVSLIVGIIGFMAVANFGFIDSVAFQMENIRSIMCEPQGTQHYVTSTNSLGWITYTKNIPHGSQDTPADLDHTLGIVKNLIHNPSEAQPYVFEFSNLQDLRRGNWLSVAGFVDQYTCDDYNTLAASKARLGQRLWAVTGNRSLESLTYCDEASAYCLDAGIIGINVRFMCSATCGCSDLHSGLWDLAQPDFGCPQGDCRKRLHQKLEHHQCKDGNKTYLKGTGWNVMLERMKAINTISEAVRWNLTSSGCEALAWLPEHQVLQICSFSEVTWHGAATFCPQACGCSHKACSGLCPQSCCA